MKVGQRLFVAVLPAVLGCVLVAALAYWGQYAYRVPAAVLAVAAVAAAASLVTSWVNTRYVAARLERLAGPGADGSQAADVGRRIADAVTGGRVSAGVDELDVIETVVDNLSGAVGDAAAAGARTKAEAAARVDEYAELLAATTAAMSYRLDEVRTPLHILLENRFGELNDNQEEMLGAASQAAEEAEVALDRLRRIVDLDRGAVAPRREAVRLGDLVPPLAQAAAAVARGEAGGDGSKQVVAVELAPALPRVLADPTLIYEALSLVLRDAVERAGSRREVTVRGEAATTGRAVVTLDVEHAGDQPPTPALALARRLIQLQGGTLSADAGVTRIAMPIARVDGTSPA